MPEEQLRTFIAIPLNQEIKNFLGQIQNKIKESEADVKWVDPKNIHLTLKFLGERKKKKIDEIIGIINNLGDNIATYQIEIFSIGAFPKKEFPRVIWTGISRGSEQTKLIAEKLEEQICQLGIPKESRPFSSHITLGRVRSNLNRKQLVQMLDYLENNFPEEKPSYQVNKITLFKSTLTPCGPIYEALYEKNLKTT